jgi:uncharacterized protein (TIGR02145 family)
MKFIPIICVFIFLSVAAIDEIIAQRDNTTQIVDVYNPKTGRTWMDRNLGAGRVATSSYDYSAFGHLYQWGRGADGHQVRNSSTTSVLSTSNSPGHGQFIISQNEPFDWKTISNDQLWQGPNQINNPCPTGFRIPTESEWVQEIQTWSSNNANGAFASVLKLPHTGARDGATGVLFNDVGVGSHTWYWTSNTSGSRVRFMAVNGSGGPVYFYDGNRATAFGVRCIKEEVETASTPIDLESGLIAYYPFDGNAEDQSPNRLDGVIYGDVQLTTDRFNREDQAFNFPGQSNSYIDVGSPENLKFGDEITISVWFFMDGGFYNPRLLQFGDAFAIATEGTSNVSRRIGSAFGELGVSTTVEALKWVNLVYTANRTTGKAKLFLNGIRVNQIYSSPSLNQLDYNKSNFNIGRMGHPAYDAWGGKLDDIRIYNRALSEAEVAALYELESTPPNHLNTEFSTQLVITNSTSQTATLTFGVADSATMDYDDALDVLAPPPAPSGTFDARLLRGEDAYFTDIIPPSDGTLTWQLSIAAGTNRLPVNISWDPESLPTSGSLTFKDAINGSFVNVDMRAVSQVDITQDYLTQFTINYKVNQEVELDFLDKWNLIGLPVTIAHDSYGTLFPGALSKDTIQLH